MSTAKIPAKPSKEVIYVDVDDEITSIIDKVDVAKQKVVALVLPKRATTLQSTVNMKLLQKSAKAAGKSVVLITSETALLPLAGAAGLHVAKNLSSRPAVPESPEAVSEIPVTDAEPTELDEATEETDEENLPAKIDYGRSIGELAAAHEVDNPETIELDDEDDEATSEPAAKKPKPSKDKKLSVPNFDRFRLVLLAGVLGLIALIVFIYLAIFVLPKATITIKGSSIQVSTNFNLATSDTASSLDETKGIIPAKLATSDQTSSQQVQATGQQNTGNKASGSVALTNCSNAAVTVPAGTGISSGGLTYITKTSTALDSGNFTSGGVCKSTGSHVGSVVITAQQAGAKYNVTISGGSVAGYPGVTASGSTSGGTDNIQTILSQQDVDGAKSKITTEDSNNFTATFEDQLKSQGWYVLKTTLKAGDPQITATPSVGQPASTANVTIKITYTVLTVKQADLTQAIKDKLNDQFDKSKQKISDNFLSGTEVTVQDQSAPTKATLSIGVDTTAVPIIDVASVKKQVVGKKTGDVRSSISTLPGVKSVDVKLSPFWVSKVPKNQSKIKVVIIEVKASSTP